MDTRHRIERAAASRPLGARTMFAVSVALAIALVAIASAAQAGPAGWHTVQDRKGRCSVELPSDWKAGALPGVFQAPDGSNAIVTSNSAATSVAEVKASATQTLKPVKTFEDSAARLWYQYEGSPGTGTGWYEAVPAPGGVCLMQLTLKAPADETAGRTIAGTLAPVK